MLGKFQYQFEYGPTIPAVGADVDCLDTLCQFSLWEISQYKLTYCLKDRSLPEIIKLLKSHTYVCK